MRSAKPSQTPRITTAKATARSAKLLQVAVYLLSAIVALLVIQVVLSVVALFELKPVKQQMAVGMEALSDFHSGFQNASLVIGALFDDPPHNQTARLDGTVVVAADDSPPPPEMAVKLRQLLVAVDNFNRLSDCLLATHAVNRTAVLAARLGDALGDPRLAELADTLYNAATRLLHALQVGGALDAVGGGGGGTEDTLARVAAIVERLDRASSEWAGARATEHITTLLDDAHTLLAGAREKRLVDQAAQAATRGSALLARIGERQLVENALRMINDSRTLVDHVLDGQLQVKL